MAPDLYSNERISATAWLLGERIDLREIPKDQLLSRSPATLRNETGGLVVLYHRYGAAVVFEGGEAASKLPEVVRGRVARPFDAPSTDDATIRIAPDEAEGTDAQGSVVLCDASLEKLQVVADVLARSALLAHYEDQLATSMDRLEPVAERLRRNGRAGLSGRRLLSDLGEVLVTEMRMVGRAEVSEKPERIWDRPDLDQLYVKLAEEYELEDRDRALSRKLELLGRSASTFLEMLQSRRSLHVEWYIVILILIEIVIVVWDMGTR
jgi:uncharacterized Rmd1/YagE family protein